MRNDFLRKTHPPTSRPNPLGLFIRLLERPVECCGHIAAWLVPALMLITIYDVTMRYFFHSGSVRLQELEWHLFALIFLLGIGHTLVHDQHARLDLLHQSRWINERRRHWVEILGTLLLLIPFCLLLIDSSLSFAAQSYHQGENSPDPGGLTHRWLLKAAIPFAFFLLLLAGLARLLRAVAALRAQPHPPPLPAPAPEHAGGDPAEGDPAANPGH